MRREGGREEGGMTVIHILIGMFNSNPMIPQYLRWPAARDMGQTRGLRFSHVLIDRHLIHHHTKAFFKTKPLNAYIRQLTTCPSCF